MYVDTGGAVGIGTTTPAAKLHVVGDLQTEGGHDLFVPANIAAFRLFDQSGAFKFNITETTGPNRIRINSGPGEALHFTTNDRNSGGMIVDANGLVGIGTTSPTSRLHVAGDVQVDGNIAAKYQDVAEWVQAVDRLPSGTLVRIDPKTHNQVLPSSQPYDTGVVGVVSARPGLILGEAGEGKAKIAHSGRVKMKVDARYGPIMAGDLLVSSPTPGHGMRSAPVNVGGITIHRPGTLIGKALEPLATGQGEILVFLTLQ